MSSYEDIVQAKDNKNWLKAYIGLRITKTGLRGLVDEDSSRIQNTIYSSLLHANDLRPGTTCGNCLTENLFQCPTRRLCSHPLNCKFHDTPTKMYRPCPLHICDDIRDKICAIHTYGEPSWKNSHANQWSTNHWEIAKCFMPPDGYKDVPSFDMTDFNGIISILLNCTAFDQRLSFKVDCVPNVLTQARDIGRKVRHSPNMTVTDADLQDYFTTMTTLLSDPTYLNGDPTAQEAVLKLNQLQENTLQISQENINTILKEATEIGKLQIEEAVTAGKKAIETGKCNFERAVAEGKDAIETEKRKIEKATTGGQIALQRGKHEIEKAMEEGKITIETGKSQIEKVVAESKDAIETGKCGIENVIAEGKDIIESGKSQIKITLAEGKESIQYLKDQFDISFIENEDRLRIRTDKEVDKVSKQISSSVVLPAEKRLTEKVQAGLIALEQSKQLIEEATGIGQRQIYSRTSEGLQALDEAVVEAKGKIRFATAAREKDLRQRLAQHYQKYLSSAPISPLVLDKDEMLDRFYVTPKIVEKDHKKVGPLQQQEGTPVTSYKEVFCKDEKFVKNIYIIGEAGMGKSTFTAKCALEWGLQYLPALNICDDSKIALETDENSVIKGATKVALDVGTKILQAFNCFSSSTETLKPKKDFDDVNILSRFEFLFHVNLRDARNLSNLSDIIKDQIIHKVYDADDVAVGIETLMSVLSKRKCLILVDGLDEWPHPHESNSANTDNGRNRPFLSPTLSATVVITSRPWWMAQYRERDSSIDKYLEIEGVANSELLVQNVLGCLGGEVRKETKTKEFMSFVKEKNMHNILAVPIVLMMFLCLWFEEVEKPFSLCEIFALMIDMMFGRKSLQKSCSMPEQLNLPRCFRNTLHICDYIKPLLSMSKLAFEKLFLIDGTSALVFNQVRSLPRDDMNILLTIGILQETKSQSLIRQSSSFSFIHKTVQEFLAALHLSFNPNELHRVEESCNNRHNGISDISQVFIYMCGLNSNIAEQMSTIMCNRVECTSSKAEIQSGYSYNVDCPEYSAVYNLQRTIARGHIEAYANCVSDIHLNLYYFTFNYGTENISTLKTLLSMNKYQVRYLRIGEPRISGEEPQEVFNHSADTLTAVELEDRVGQYDLSTCSKLSFLRIWRGEISDISINTECLVTCELLWTPPVLAHRILHLLTTNAVDAALTIRFNFLKHFAMFDIINVDLFCKTLPQLSQLEYLNIGETDFGDLHLHLPGSVTRVRLDRVTMKASAFQALLDRIDESTHTVTCWLGDCMVTPKCEFERQTHFIQSCQKYNVIEEDGYYFAFERNI